MKITELIIIAFATWRLASLLTSEAGPFHVFEKLRELAGITHDPDGNVQMVPGKFFAELFSCVWCSSIWIGAVLTIAWFFFPVVMYWVCLPFFVSAWAIMIERLVRV